MNRSDRLENSSAGILPAFFVLVLSAAVLVLVIVKPPPASAPFSSFQGAAAGGMEGPLENISDFPLLSLNTIKGTNSPV